MDENPEFVEFLKAQTTRVRLLSKTGIGSKTVSHEEARSLTKRLRDQKELNNERERTRRAAEKKRSEELYQAELRLREEERLAQKAKVERLWKITMKKITFHPPTSDYYDSCPIQPGLGFFSQLLKHPKMSATGLPIRIPEMLFVHNSIIWVKTEETPTGPQLQVNTEFRIVEFHKGFPRPTMFKKPVAVLRLPGDSVPDLKAMPLTHEELSSKLNASQLPSFGMVQRYIHCHADKLAVTRVFYFAQSKANISSYAFALTASRAAERFQYGDRILLAEVPGAVDVFHVSGVALNRSIESAQVVVSFLQQAYSVRIESIVLDFLRDSTDRLWLLSCKGVQVDPTSMLFRELMARQAAEMSPDELLAMKKDQLNEQQSSIHCKLCLMPYKPTEMTHVLPFKMLLLFKHHTSHSGRRPFDMSHLRVNTMDFLSHWVRLCEICYLLVLHEYELIETERTLANVLNIPAKIPDVMNEPVVDQPNFLPQKMHQWRILLYFSSIEFLGPHHDKGNIYLQYTFFGEKFCYPLDLSKDCGTTSELHVTRLYYLFSPDNLEVKRFASGCESHFRLTKGKEWDWVISQGTCHPLTPFSCEMCDNDALCQPLDLVFFASGEVTHKIHLIVGLTRDRAVNVREMPVSIYRYHGIYIPEQTYINSEPLPTVWMEAFSLEYKGLEKTEMLNSSEEIEDMYTPKLSQKAVYSQPLSSTRVLHTNVDLDPFPRAPRPVQSAKSIRKQLPDDFQLPASMRPRETVQSLKPNSPSRLSRPSLSTTASSKVIYQLDCSSKLKSPTFLSPRPFTARPSLPHPHEIITADSFDELHALFPDSQGPDLTEDRTSEAHLRDTVSHYLQKRSKSGEFHTEEAPLLTETESKTLTKRRPKTSRRKLKRAKSAHQVKKASRRREMREIYGDLPLFT